MMLKKNISKYLIGGLLSVFFVLYSWSYLFGQGLFYSPDETSNYLFAQEFFASGDLTIDRFIEGDYLIRPRSVNINHEGDYVPGGFLGMPLFYGSAANFLGAWSLLIMPALIAVLGVIAFVDIVKHYLGKQSARKSLFLLLVLPPWWYFASRGFLPNVSMISFYLMSFALILRATEKQGYSKQLLFIFFALVCFLIAVVIRPISLMWALPIVLAAFYHKKIKFTIAQVVTIFGGVIVFGLLYAAVAQSTYGGYFATGYDVISEPTSQSTKLVSQLSQVFFPFGIQIFEAFSRFWVYTLLLVFPYLVLFAFGVVHFFKKSAEHKKYLTLFTGVSVYLILYYGSWSIIDHPDASRVSISISYMRYWLPIYLFAIPICLKGVEYLQAKIRHPWGSAIFFSLIAIYGSFIVYGYQDDSLGELVTDVVNYKEIQATVFNETSSDDIILSSRNDKLFWPQREVIHMQDQDFGIFTEIAGLQTKNTVYWFTDLPVSHLATVQEYYLDPVAIVLGEQKTLIDGYALYELVR